MTEVPIKSIEYVGPQTVAVTLKTPCDFDAFPGQFVLIRATVDGEETTGYYTISSPNIEQTFEITADVDPDGTLGPWLANCNPGQSITIDGPFGDIKYSGEENPTVLASGPGVGPAIGIGERAIASGHSATIVYEGSQPPHETRLDTLLDEGATIAVVHDLENAANHVDSALPGQTYVFGFNEFVKRSKEFLSSVGIDPSSAEIESFGPE